MLTRSKNHATKGALIGLILGALATSASATETEEVVVYGADATAAARAERVLLESQLKDVLEFLNEQLKDELDKGLKERPRANIELALGDVPSRG